MQREPVRRSPVAWLCRQVPRAETFGHFVTIATARHGATVTVARAKTGAKLTVAFEGKSVAQCRVGLRDPDGMNARIAEMTQKLHKLGCTVEYSAG